MERQGGGWPLPAGRGTRRSRDRLVFDGDLGNHNRLVPDGAFLRRECSLAGHYATRRERFVASKSQEGTDDKKVLDFIAATLSR